MYNIFSMVYIDRNVWRDPNRYTKLVKRDRLNSPHHAAHSPLILLSDSLERARNLPPQANPSSNKSQNKRRRHRFIIDCLWWFNFLREKIANLSKYFIFVRDKISTCLHENTPFSDVYWFILTFVAICFHYLSYISN